MHGDLAAAETAGDRLRYANWAVRALLARVLALPALPPHARARAEKMRGAVDGLQGAPGDRAHAETKAALAAVRGTLRDAEARADAARTRADDQTCALAAVQGTLADLRRAHAACSETIGARDAALAEAQAARAALAQKDAAAAEAQERVATGLRQQYDGRLAALERELGALRAAAADARAKSRLQSEARAQEVEAARTALEELRREHAASEDILKDRDAAVAAAHADAEAAREELARAREEHAVALAAQERVVEGLRRAKAEQATDVEVLREPAAEHGHRRRLRELDHDVRALRTANAALEAERSALRTAALARDAAIAGLRDEAAALRAANAAAHRQLATLRADLYGQLVALAEENARLHAVAGQSSESVCGQPERAAPVAMGCREVWVRRDGQVGWKGCRLTEDSISLVRSEMEHAKIDTESLDGRVVESPGRRSICI